jgi:anaerobic magnesium-protoporphyrin IX monomethyl ester cyclase
MLSILVCHSYYLRLDQKQVLRAKPYPPLATLQVVAQLREAGHRVTFFDAMLADGTDEYDRLLAERPQIVLIYEDNYNFLSKMCLGAMRRAACEMIGSAHRMGARVIAAGPDVTDAPAPYLKAGADLALIGEGIFALFQVLPRLESNPHVAAADLAIGMTGIASLVGGRVTGQGAHGHGPHAQGAHGHNAHGLSGLNGAAVAAEVGLAAWELVDMDRYRAVWLKAHGYFSLNMAASRGCPFRCNWCAKPIWGNQYLQRSAVEVAEEMAYLKRSFNPDHIWFADDIFGFRVDWVAQFAASVKSLDARIPFTIQTRADLVSERMAEVLRDAGCKEAWIGAESGSQRVLDAMNKGTTVTEIRAARARFKAVGIRVGFFIQLGYMGEDLSDILATRELLQAARPDEIGVSVSYPLPGTKFYELVKAELGGKTHWLESNDLDMMFHGTYTSDFYRSVRNLMHDQISLQTPGGSLQERRRVRNALELRWQELLCQEHLYRSPPRQAAATG